MSLSSSLSHYLHCLLFTVYNWPRERRSEHSKASLDIKPIWNSKLEILHSECCWKYQSTVNSSVTVVYQCSRVLFVILVYYLRSISKWFLSLRKWRSDDNTPSHYTLHTTPLIRWKNISVKHPQSQNVLKLRRLSFSKFSICLKWNKELQIALNHFC